MQPFKAIGKVEMFVLSIGFITVCTLSVFCPNSVHAKTIVVCIDGTGNHPDDAMDAEKDTTNVFRLADALVRDSDQIVKYFPGVGTSDWKLIDAKGQWFGFGAKSLREDAYHFLNNSYSPHDNIFLFGFSRGAAIVRDLANRIHDDGLSSYREVSITFLGLWDTVAAFGVPIDMLGLPTQSTNIGKKLNVPQNVKQTYHLLAIDEQRTPYIPTLIEMAPNVEEVWFAGTHADVGGGYKDRQLADISLGFMIKVVQDLGIRFTEETLALIDSNPTGQGLIHEYTGEFFSVKPRKIVVRKNNKASVSAYPKVHRTVLERMKLPSYQPINVLLLEDFFKVVD